MGWPDEAFHVPEDARAHMAECVTRGAEWISDWRARHDAWTAAHPDRAQALAQALRNELPAEWSAGLPTFDGVDGLATRQASGASLNALSQAVPTLIGGSADLAGSTGTVLKQAGMITATESGRSIAWGIREHGMGAVMNGISAPRWLPPLRQHVPGLLGLHEAVDPPGGAHGAADDLHLHP